jgi:cytidylate kinase
MIIAIDGPAGSGKSTVAKLLALKLNFSHIETGSMYRAVAWAALDRGIDLKDREQVANVAKTLAVEFIPASDGQTVMLGERNLTPLIKTERISEAAATVAAYPAVRDTLTAQQRQMGKNGNVVMEGRDIGTVVFPTAERKFFLDARPEERGKRRFQELLAKGQQVDLQQVIDQVKQRDHEDRNRPVSPLRPADDAILIDTTDLNIEEVVDTLVRLVKSAKASQ